MPPRMKSAPKPEFQPVIMFADGYSKADELAIADTMRQHEIVVASMNTERNRQQTIGISAIGNPCGQCVARALSGLYDNSGDMGNWKAHVGTAIHSMLEKHYVDHHPGMHVWDEELQKWEVELGYQPSDDAPAYHLERKLLVWEYKGLVLKGSCDLFVEGESYGIVHDWKTQNLNKLRQKTSKGDIGQTYTVQMHTYGLGYELLGMTPTHVRLWALPRDGEIGEARAVLMRYDRQIALDALARLASMIDAAEIVGWPMVIERQPRAMGCFDCARFDAQDEQMWIAELTA